eukprot:m.245205 g.245205  ORF g.245205 m.245205 type:complete len:73 (+) comp16107_c0_seq6:176-394(+)
MALISLSMSPCLFLVFHLFLFVPTLCGSMSTPINAPPFNTTWFRSYSPDVNLTVGNDTLTWNKPLHFTAVFS